MKTWEIILALAAMAVLYKLNIYIDSKLEILRVQLDLEKREQAILKELDEIIKQQEELSSSYKLYEDLGNEEKTSEIHQQFKDNQSKYFNLKSRIQ